MLATRAVVTLLLFMSSAGCHKGPPSPAAGPDENESRAARAIDELGGRYERDETKPGRPLVWISLWNTRVSDAFMKNLSGLKSLHTLDLHDTPISDVGLKELSGVKSLRKLYLEGTKITDAGLKEIRELDLQEVTLINTKVTSAGVADLRSAQPYCKIDRFKLVSEGP